MCMISYRNLLHYLGQLSGKKKGTTDLKGEVDPCIAAIQT